MEHENQLNLFEGTDHDRATSLSGSPPMAPPAPIPRTSRVPESVPGSDRPTRGSQSSARHDRASELLHRLRDAETIRRVVVDFETYYDDKFSLGALTAPEYILDPRFEAHGCAVKCDCEPATWFTSEQLREFLALPCAQGATFASHNALFDMAILAWRYDFTPVRMVDTLGMSRALLGYVLAKHNLHAIATYFGLPIEEKVLPRVKGRRQSDPPTDLFDNASELWDLLARDAENDAELCAEIYDRLIGEFPESEQMVMDTVIRCALDPQLTIDHTLLGKHLNEIRAKKAELLLNAGFDADTVMSNNKLAAALIQLGADPPTKISPRTNQEAYAFSKQDSAFLAMQDHEDPKVAELIKARLGIKSTIEETRSVRMMGIAQLQGLNGRFPVSLRYGAAHTHRFGGEWGLNPQNLPRGGKLRQSLRALPGHAVVVADLSQIEARLVAYIAGQNDLVEAFRQGRDIYSEFATKLFGKLCSKKTPIERFIGKTIILASGYGMGPDKLRNQIAVMSQNMLGEKIAVSRETAQEWTDTYRSTYSKIRNSWQSFNAAIEYIAGVSLAIPTIAPMCTFQYEKILLPSGLCLFYHNLKRDNNGEWWFTYGGEYKKLWGGTLCENVVQSLARIIITDAMLRLRERGYKLTLQVHDEVVYSIREEYIAEAKAEIMEELCRPPLWAPGLPVAAEVNHGPSYGEAK
jgi:DNA polymerase III epsilon subunit-like protein